MGLYPKRLRGTSGSLFLSQAGRKFADYGSHTAFYTTFSMPGPADISNHYLPRKRGVRSLPLTRQNAAAVTRSTVDNNLPLEYPRMDMWRQLEGRYIVEWGR